MFKLPLLQPQLTGPNGIEKRESQSIMAPFGGAGARSGKESDLAAAVAAAQTATFDVRGWSRQAKEITSDLTGSDKYKSLALHAEVKLAEALERCERVSPITRTSSGEERPNKLRTAVVCQLLGEFAELCGPFSGVLTTLRDELLKGVYSWHYASERGGLSFDQLPWFSVSDRLERDKEAMMEEREAFKQQLQEQQGAVARIEEQMNALRRATELAQQEAATLRSQLDRMVVSEESARLEAKTGREELKKLRKEYLKMKDELEAEREAHTKLQERHAELNEFSAARIAELSAALAASEVEAVDARRLAESRMPPEVYEKLQATLADTQSELELAQSHIRDVEAVNTKLAHRLDVMTPRPVWRKIAEHNIQSGRRTAELVHRVEEKLGRYANELEELKSRLNLAAALLQPDAAPTEVQLTLVTEDSNYFLTEGGGSTTSSGPAVAEPCGLAPTVPRCLRWPQRVTLQTLSQEQTEAIIMAMWKARQAMDVLSSSGTLQSFVYYYFNPQGMATADTARMCYSFYYACSTYAKSSAVVRTFWLVVTGQVSEATATDQRIMVSGLAALLHNLPAAISGEGDSLPGDRVLHVDDISSALERLFPNRPSFRISKLRDALRSQFNGAETLRLDALQVLLEPHGLQAPPASTAPGTAKATRFRQDLLGPGNKGGAAGGVGGSGVGVGGSHPVGPLVSMLLAQHIDEIQNLCMEVATQLSDTATAVDQTDGEHGDSPAEVVAVVEKLGALLGPSRAAACVLTALGFSTSDGSGSRRRSSAEGDDVSSGGGGGDDIVMPMGAIVDLSDMTAWVLRRCLIKPVGSYDISGAMQWAREALEEAGS